jgi:hypothetical protein
MYCPKCGSSNVYVGKKGYGYGKGCLGFIIMLPFALVFSIIGLFLGAIGANKLKMQCLSCGKKW